MKQLAPRGPRQLTHHVAHGFKLHAVHCCKVILVFDQKIHVTLVHAIIDRGFDMKDVEMLVDDFAEPHTLMCQLRARRIHVTVRFPNCLWLVMRAQRFVIAQADGNRLVPAVHRHEIDVAID